VKNEGTDERGANKSGDVNSPSKGVGKPLRTGKMEKKVQEKKEKGKCWNRERVVGAAAKGEWCNVGKEKNYFARCKDRREGKS